MDATLPLEEKQKLLYSANVDERAVVVFDSNSIYKVPRMLLIKKLMVLFVKKCRLMRQLPISPCGIDC